MLARLRLIPQDARFFDLFNRSAENTLEGARLLDDLMNNYVDVERKTRHLKDIEHTGDEITHEVFGALHRTFVTPIDREDISNLASSLDDVIDWIEEVGRRIHLYRVDQPTEIARPRRSIGSKTKPTICLRAPSRTCMTASRRCPS